MKSSSYVYVVLRKDGDQDYVIEYIFTSNKKAKMYVVDDDTRLIEKIEVH